MKAFGVIWVHLCVAALLTVVSTGLANAQCSEQGWALGSVAEGDTAIHYVAEGPARAWTVDGWTDSAGDFWKIDDRLAHEGVLILSVREKDGTVLRVSLFQVEVMCGYVSNPDEKGQRVVLGNLTSLESHIHPDVRPFGHKWAADEVPKRS
jgi:hypothetical protein